MLLDLIEKKSAKEIKFSRLDEDLLFDYVLEVAFGLLSFL